MFYFWLETRDVYFNIKRNMRKIRSPLHNYKKHHNMIELLHHTRILYKRFRLQHNIQICYLLKFRLSSSQWCLNPFNLHTKCQLSRIILKESLGAWGLERGIEIKEIPQPICYPPLILKKFSHFYRTIQSKAKWDKQFSKRFYLCGAPQNPIWKDHHIAYSPRWNPITLTCLNR